ncbi:MAG TPA: sodium:proton antiporter, partial [Acetobacteraceae bacterium]|nr:sodium:proton antiporter [Acetobacteraceae bacterium]
LLFDAALCIDWRDLRRDMLPVAALATIGVVIAAATVATGLVFLFGWSAPPAVMFAVLIAATDPVAVIALFRDLNIHGRLLFLLETESILNDGVAAVFFGLALSWAATQGAPPGFLAITGQFIVNAGGGVAIGTVSGLLAIFIAGRTSDRVLETALTTVAAYGSFYLAQRLLVSGVLATVAAGLVMGNIGLLRPEERSPLSEAGRAAVEGFWEYAAFLANSLVFLLIGLEVADISLHRLSPMAIAGIIALVLVARALTVYPLSLLFRGSRFAIPLREQHVLFWGGLRGALGLALALALPADFAWRDDILLATFSTVVFSVVVQGLTMQPLLRWLGIRPGPSERPILLDN